ncbi:MAG: uroporphyrinogen decarboxylase [Halobacteria archaeon]|nr:uroporphyrinogen decarboxylase [Halobacteria archaeon]
MSDLLVRAARGERTERPPVWLMRQAGRYIPEYREIRKEYSFKEAIKDPEVAERITLLPWNLFEPDGLVMFSDILTVLEPLGFEYEIKSGVGPVVDNPVESPGDAEREVGDVEEEIQYVGKLLRRLNRSVGDETSIIGFSGAPFTLASYVVGESEKSKSFMDLRKFRANHPDALKTLLDGFAEVVADYLEFQVENGADVVQVFDTWAGIMSPDDYEEFVLPYQRKAIDAADVPTVVFVRNSAGRLDLLKESGADVVSLDWTVDIGEAREELGETPVQGNLDPSYLFGDEEFVRRKTRDVIERAGDTGHILNLGHGVNRDTPVENVRAFVETAKEVEREL